MKKIIFFAILMGALSMASFAENPLLHEMVEQWTLFTKERPQERIYLQFDKPFYKPGDTIWFQVYLRNAHNFTASETSAIVHIEWISPKGSIEQHLRLITKNGIASGDLAINDNANGGLYKIKAYTHWQKNEAATLLFEKEIPVQKTVLPNLKMKLDFKKEAYGAGEEVVAHINLEKLDNTALKNTFFNFYVNIKGEKFLEQKSSTDHTGLALIRFNLPQKLDSSDGLLNIVIPFEGNNESISRSIPIILNHIAMEFYPEGGELIQGLSARVAFRALNEYGKPADVAGKIFNQQHQLRGEFSSFHQGMGAFTLIPEATEKYYIKITQPQGVDLKLDLPQVQPRGYTLSVKENFPNDRLEVSVNTTEKEQLFLIAQMRGNILFSQSVPAVPGENRLSIRLQDMPMGVLQLTLFDAKKIARAERLVFINRSKQLKVAISSDKDKYLPREKVRLSIKVSDERGISLPAQLSLSVTNDKIISFADDQSGHILAKLSLEPELKNEVYKPNFYFNENEERSLQALDYLMMTQGWRRFTWEEVQQNKKFAPGFPAEQTLIKGRVIGVDNQGVEGAKITLKSSKKTFLSGKSGYFSIPELELYAIEELQATFGDASSMTHYINDYSEPLEIRLYRGGYPTPMPIMEGLFLNAPMAGEVLKNKKIPELRKLKPEEDKFVMKNQPIVVAEKIMADDLKLDQLNVEEKREMAKIMPRNRRLMVPEPQEKQVLYRRAREFPKLDYPKTPKIETRNDFRDTIFWQGYVVVDRKGQAAIEFYNSDEITAFRTTVEGIGTGGLLGRKEYLHYTQLPFSLSAKIPIAVTLGDKIILPVTLLNRTSRDIHGSFKVLPPEGWKERLIPKSDLVIKAHKTLTVYPEFEITPQAKEGEFSAKFSSPFDQDAFTQKVKVLAKGFPVSLAVSAQQMEKAFFIEPKNLIAGTLTAELNVFPTSLSELLKGIEAILSEPYGCFEQASSSTYPNILILRYLNEQGIKDKTITEKANKLIESGYKRLVAYETKEKGYEWFGGSPAHEALTAYGLMEFKDMTSVYGQVSPDMMKRTGEWLLSRKDGKGGFKRSAQALDSFGGADADITNAYIVYALSEAGYHFEIQTEIEKAFAVTEASKDPYLIGLVVNTLFNIQDGRAEKLLQQLLKLQQQDGHWQGTKHSITRSTGLGLNIETTSLAILALLKSKQVNHLVLTRAVSFMIASRSPNGGFSNTQSTIMALRALTAFAKFSKRTAESGKVMLFIDGKKASEKSYAAGEKNVIHLGGLHEYIKEGKHEIKVQFVGVKNPLPFTFALKYNTFLPHHATQSSVELKTALKQKQVKMGDTVRLDVELRNKTQTGLPMTMAIIGIPGGLSPQPWQLKELQEKKVFDFFETMGNDVVIYYRQMSPAEKKTIQLDLKAEIPGDYEASASRAYLYYTNEFKHWTGGLKINIAAP